MRAVNDYSGREREAVPVRLRSHLVLLVLAAMLPLLVFAVVIVRQDLAERSDIMARGMRDTARALSLAVDGEVKTSLAVLRTLAGSPLIDRGDLRTFHEICARAMEDRPGAYVVLFDRAGKALLNSSRPYGAILPNPIKGTKPPGADERYPEVPLGGGDPVKRVLETGEPVISDLFISLVTQAPRIGLDLPVTRAGEVRYVLELSLDAAEFTHLLAAQRPAGDSVLALVDRGGIAIARSRNAQSRVGKRLGPEIARLIANSPSGSGVGHTAEGLPVYQVHERSALTGWTMSLAIARAVALAPLSDALYVLAAGAAMAVLAGLAAALVIGRRLSVPIAQLAASADRLARGEETALDVSAVRELDELHAALARGGIAARKAAETQAANRAKDEFLATLSHELRNPLAALTSAAHVLKVSDPQQAAAIKARGIIERQTRLMARLVEDLLDVSRISVGKMRLERAPLELGALAQRVVDTWRSGGRLAAHRVSCRVASAWVDADRARMEQIVGNLLDNAVKFTPAGKAIALAVRREGRDVLLEVADEGQGMTEELRARVFDLFTQGADSSLHGRTGLGLGLALVRQLAEMHDGSVSAHSEGPGRGSALRLRLPAIEAPSGLSAHAASARVSPRRVLIVEDNDDTRHMLQALLALGGHKVAAARDADSGLAAAAKLHPEVALIDIGLPDVDGYELARRLRRMDGERIGLIAITGYGQPEDQRRARDAGFDAHLVKPVNEERLKEIIATLP